MMSARGPGLSGGVTAPHPVARQHLDLSLTRTRHLILFEGLVQDNVQKACVFGILSVDQESDITLTDTKTPVQGKMFQ